MARGAAPALQDTRQLQVPEKPPTAAPLQGNGSRVASSGAGSVRRGPQDSERVCAKAGARRGFPLRAGAQWNSLQATEGRHCERRRRHAFDGAKLCAAQDPGTVEGGCSGRSPSRPRPPLAPPGRLRVPPGAPAASRARGTRSGWPGRREGGRARWDGTGARLAAGPPPCPSPPPPSHLPTASANQWTPRSTGQRPRRLDSGS